jgi:hypothetical protein
VYRESVRFGLEIETPSLARKPVVSASQESDGGAVDSGLCVGDFEEDLPVPVASAGSVILQSEGKLG